MRTAPLGGARCRLVSFAALCVLGASLGSGAARADSNDLTLERIIGPPTTFGAFNDPTLAQQTAYKSLMSELSVAMAPRILAPADTLGYSGFQIAFESSFTQISNKADYWQKGVQNVSGGFLPTISVFARKGIWLPLPGFEIGAGATKLVGANMYAAQVYAKLALHEGFHGWPIPSLAVRASASRVLGSTQVDLTIVSVDGEVSKSFGIAGTFKIDPYLGANCLLTFIRGQVIDTTPNIDAYGGGKTPSSLDLNSNTVFPDPDTIVRWRLFGGFRVVYAFLALTADYAYTLCNSSGSSCGQTSTTKVMDRSGGQSQISLSGSLLF